jgi:hypothetical protein
VTNDPEFRSAVQDIRMPPGEKITLYKVAGDKKLFLGENSWEANLPGLDEKTIVYLVDNTSWLKRLARRAGLMRGEQQREKDRLDKVKDDRVGQREETRLDNTAGN